MVCPLFVYSSKVGIIVWNMTEWFIDNNLATLYMYEITPYTKAQAKKLGVQVKPSTRKGKKIDVFKDGDKVASIGALGMGDYPTFQRTQGKAFADKRRELYKVRHAKFSSIKGTPSFYANALLW